jgi:hypothetical protein
VEITYYSTVARKSSSHLKFLKIKAGQLLYNKNQKAAVEFIFYLKNEKNCYCTVCKGPQICP